MLGPFYVNEKTDGKTLRLHGFPRSFLQPIHWMLDNGILRQDAMFPLADLTFTDLPQWGPDRKQIIVLSSG